ncbi:hypothetical protein GCM10025881_18330 [Pseudolysinimonas kribbensis]|uniref:Uncharacterized protein n=1 Tax=Pseudolysinimonas kribbensis TaxID=433641 RepID=A0ABQ6K3U0_9MICO|nr:hypothetical protein GCM10025881_18330 [Pseudolysinimonas kribbensis]
MRLRPRERRRVEAAHARELRRAAGSRESRVVAEGRQPESALAQGIIECAGPIERPVRDPDLRGQTLVDHDPQCVGQVLDGSRRVVAVQQVEIDRPPQLVRARARVGEHRVARQARKPVGEIRVAPFVTSRTPGTSPCARNQSPIASSLRP